MSNNEALQRWARAEQHLRAGNDGEAVACLDSLVDDPVLASPAHLRLSLLAAARGAYRESVEHAVAAFRKRTPDPDLLEMLARRLIVLGETRMALDCIGDPAMRGADGATLAGVGRLLSDASFPREALEFLKLARQRGQDTPTLRYLLALNRFYAEGGEAARAELETLAAAHPDMAVAQWALSKAGGATEGDGRRRADRIRAAIGRRPPGAPDLPLLHYALFNELDRIGDTEAAWSALDAGMRARRAQIGHDPAADDALFRHLEGIDGGDVGAATDDGGPRPVFIVGMPRSGTTLLERILGNHPAVADAGELADFTMQLRWCADLDGSGPLDLALARRADRVDFAELGRRYLDHSRWRARGRPVYTDKMPSNFLCIPYILRALPQARILHMTRGPMDTCFSNLKELFASGYAHSFEQTEMAGHFRNYRSLMARWRSVYPGRILDVRYDELVNDAGNAIREILEYCGLEPIDGLARMETRADPVPTASAGQVREPIHDRYIGQWRRYEQHLGPLKQQLGALAY